MTLSKSLREDLQPIIFFGKDRKQLLQLKVNYTRTIVLFPTQGPSIVTLTSDDNRNLWTNCSVILIQICNHIKLYQKKYLQTPLEFCFFLKCTCNSINGSNIDIILLRESGLFNSFDRAFTLGRKVHFCYLGCLTFKCNVPEMHLVFMKK